MWSVPTETYEQILIDTSIPRYNWKNILISYGYSGIVRDIDSAKTGDYVLLDQSSTFRLMNKHEIWKQNLSPCKILIENNKYFKISAMSITDLTRYYYCFKKINITDLEVHKVKLKGLTLSPQKEIW